jgi:hypothetical protein
LLTSPPQGQDRFTAYFGSKVFRARFAASARSMPQVRQIDSVRSTTFSVSPSCANSWQRSGLRTPSASATIEAPCSTRRLSLAKRDLDA